MKKYHLSIIFIFIAAALVTSAKAGDLSRPVTSTNNATTSRPSRNPVVATIDGQSFTTGQMVSDLMDVAFSDKVWNGDISRTEFESCLNSLSSGPTSQAAHDDFTKGVAWLSPYIYRQDAWPKSGVINKWPGDIIIALGIPNHGSYAGGGAIDTIMEDQITSLLPALSKATGHEVKFIKAYDTLGNTRPNADIRILVDKSLIAQRLSFEGGAFSYEPTLWGGVLFGDSDENIRGYLLPKADDNIGLGICKIQAWETMPIVRSLVTRCVLRAMGLPGVSNRKLVTMLGNTGLPRPTDPGSFKEHASTAEDARAPHPTLSAYDLKMLALLYCAAIKSGMTKNEVIQALAAKKECPLGP